MHRAPLLSHRRLLAATLLVATAAATAPALAQTGLGGFASEGSRALTNMRIADRDGDGLISREEAEKGPVPFIRAHFDQIDREHRGAVSIDDVKAYVQSLQRKPAAAAAKPAPASSAG